jgi:hypothetical protein
MISIANPPRQTLKVREDEQFLELIPDIERYARFAFRALRLEEREEAVAEVVAYAFCAFRRLVERGKLDVAYATPLARFGIARFRSGWLVGNRLSPRDVYSVAAQHRRGFCLQRVQTTGAKSEVWVESLADDTITPVPDQVAFRLEFAAWMGGLSRRERMLVEFLALGNTPSDAAQRFRVSRARVSQLRVELKEGWQEFWSDAPQTSAATVT